MTDTSTSEQLSGRFLQLVFYLIGIALSLPAAITAQNTRLPLYSTGQYEIERMLIQHGKPFSIHPSVRPFTRQDAVELVLRTDTLQHAKTNIDRHVHQYLLNDNSEWVAKPDSHRISRRARPLFGVFYKNPANFFEVNTEFFHLRINPMLHLQLGTEPSDSVLLFANQRGLEVRGDIDERVYFYSNIVETQQRFPNYINNWIDTFQSIPGAGFYKSFDSRLFKSENAYDFNLAEAFVGVKVSKHIGLELGHGRHFIGNGYRSLLLSDVGNYRFYLKFNTRVWRLQLQNLFLELSPISTAVPRPQNSLLPKKFMAAHYLSFQAGKNLSFGFLKPLYLTEAGSLNSSI